MSNEGTCDSHYDGMKLIIICKEYQIILLL